MFSYTNSENVKHVLQASIQCAFTCSKSATETVEQSMKSVQSQEQRHQNNVNNVIVMSLLLILNRFHALF